GNPGLPRRSWHATAAPAESRGPASEHSGLGRGRARASRLPFAVGADLDERQRLAAGNRLPAFPDETVTRIDPILIPGPEIDRWRADPLVHQQDMMRAPENADVVQAGRHETRGRDDAVAVIGQIQRARGGDGRLERFQATHERTVGG